MLSLSVSSDFAARVPQFKGAFIEVTVQNSATSPTLWAEIEASCQQLQADFTTDTIKSRSSIAATRAAYKACGKDPSRYRPASEQLSRRVLQGKGLYSVDTLVDLGYKPDLIVGNPAGIGAEALRSGAKVVLPADPDGHGIGLERIQDLGVGAMTFPAASDSATDLALLLADYHGASMIVNAGSPLDLGMIFNEEPEATPSALLTRAKVGAKLVDARSVIELYTIRSAGNLAWLWVIFGLLVAVGVIVAIAGTAGDGSFADNLVNTWNNMTGTVRGWFR